MHLLLQEVLFITLEAEEGLLIMVIQMVVEEMAVAVTVLLPIQH